MSQLALVHPDVHAAVGELGDEIPVRDLDADDTADGRLTGGRILCRQRGATAQEMPTRPAEAVETFAIYVGFDQIKNPKERRDFLDLPTTFALPKDEVDKLRKIGPKILDESEGFQKLCAELKCQVK